MTPRTQAILFALLVACCWGLYGPTLSKARGVSGPFKPYVFIGVAYLVLAIIGGAAMMKLGGAVGLPVDSFNYGGEQSRTAIWGFLAGCLGALGALFLTFAVVKTQGNPALVMPIVFGGAVTVNAIAAFVHMGEADWKMWMGMAIVAVGIYFVAGYTPHGGKPAKAEDVAAEQPADPAPAESTEPVAS